MQVPRWVWWSGDWRCCFYPLIYPVIVPLVWETWVRGVRKRWAVIIKRLKTCRNSSAAKATMYSLLSDGLICSVAWPEWKLAWQMIQMCFTAERQQRTLCFSSSLRTSRVKRLWEVLKSHGKLGWFYGSIHFKHCESEKEVKSKKCRSRWVAVPAPLSGVQQQRYEYSGMKWLYK